MVPALLLARAGIEVTLLEKHGDPDAAVRAAWSLPGRLRRRPAEWAGRSRAASPV
ncbi:hypothetical protein AB0I68_19475 [Streptomyces sp. NPDC050448]|uniref:hypothetical protein n=1 Tax=Streptomyces sp. NPDC050448 TaxID=3155404 RepID=UPI00341846B0